MRGDCYIFMKQIITSNILFTILLSVLCGGVFAQQHVVQAKNGLNARPRNYTFFTAPNKDNNPEVVKRNSGFEQHPELGAPITQMVVGDDLLA